MICNHILVFRYKVPTQTHIWQRLHLLKNLILWIMKWHLNSLSTKVHTILLLPTITGITVQVKTSNIILFWKVNLFFRSFFFGLQIVSFSSTYLVIDAWSRESLFYCSAINSTSVPTIAVYPFSLWPHCGMGYTLIFFPIEFL